MEIIILFGIVFILGIVGWGIAVINDRLSNIEDKLNKYV